MREYLLLGRVLIDYEIYDQQVVEVSPEEVYYRCVFFNCLLVGEWVMFNECSFQDGCKMNMNNCLVYRCLIVR